MSTWFLMRFFDSSQVFKSLNAACHAIARRVTAEVAELAEKDKKYWFWVVIY